MILFHNKINNWYKTPNRAPISFRNIWAVIQAWYRKIDYDTPNHIIEQQEWRMTKVDPICKLNGYCKECGCDLDKTWEDRACEGGCYPKMKNKEDWSKFKKNGYK